MEPEMNRQDSGLSGTKETSNSVVSTSRTTAPCGQSDGSTAYETMRYRSGGVTEPASMVREEEAEAAYRFLTLAAFGVRESLVAE